MGTKKKPTKKKLTRSQLARAIHRRAPSLTVAEVAEKVERQTGKAMALQSVRNALRASDRIGRPPEVAA
jgi:3-polyprenyl-4-hydroxybenzoate decarboxylase